MELFFRDMRGICFSQRIHSSDSNKCWPITFICLMFTHWTSPNVTAFWYILNYKSSRICCFIRYQNFWICLQCFNGFIPVPVPVVIYSPMTFRWQLFCANHFFCHCSINKWILMKCYKLTIVTVDFISCTEVCS